MHPPSEAFQLTGSRFPVLKLGTENWKHGTARPPAGYHRQAAETIASQPFEPIASSRGERDMRLVVATIRNTRCRALPGRVVNRGGVPAADSPDLSSYPARFGVALFQCRND